MSLLEGEALLMVLVVNNPLVFSFWSFANCISDISLVCFILFSK
jgi:hypothetical protein